MQWALLRLLVSALIARAYVAGRRMLSADDHADVCCRGFDMDLGSFVQAYGSKALDATLLLLPILDSLPPPDAHRDPIALPVAIMSSQRACEDGPCTKLQHSPTSEPTTRSALREWVPE